MTEVTVRCVLQGTTVYDVSYPVDDAHNIEGDWQKEIDIDIPCVLPPFAYTLTFTGKSEGGTPLFKMGTDFRF